MNRLIRERIKKLYSNKKRELIKNTNNDIIKKEIEKYKSALSYKQKNIRQREYYKKNKQYYKNKATIRYNNKADDINEKRRQLYKQRLNNNNIELKPLFDKKTKLQRCQQHAKDNGGKCLSTEYNNRLTHLKWQCKQGHIWTASPHNVLNKNQWCPKCSAVIANSNRKLSWTNIKKLATKKGGRLLSSEAEYINTYSKLKWQCKHGHVWKASIESIKYGNTWCPQCKTGYKEELSRYIFETFTGLKFPKRRPKWLKNPETNKNLEIDGFNEKYKIGFEYNGIQHYRKNEFFHKNTSLKKQQKHDKLKKDRCLKNNVRLCVIKNIKDDNKLKIYIRKWLNNNNINIICDADLSKMKLFKFSRHEKFKRFLESLDYELLTTYKGVNTKVKIKCDNGHIWTVQPRAVKNGNRCPYCSKRIKYDLDIIKEHSDKLNLKCLEKEYINNTQWMRFKCIDCNKIITRTSTQIINGNGCKCEEEKNGN